MYLKMLARLFWRMRVDHVSVSGSARRRKARRMVSDIHLTVHEQELMHHSYRHLVQQEFQVPERRKPNHDEFPRFSDNRHRDGILWQTVFQPRNRLYPSTIRRAVQILSSKRTRSSVRRIHGRPDCLLPTTCTGAATRNSSCHQARLSAS